MAEIEFWAADFRLDQQDRHDFKKISLTEITENSEIKRLNEIVIGGNRSLQTCMRSVHFEAILLYLNHPVNPVYPVK